MKEGNWIPGTCDDPRTCALAKPRRLRTAALLKAALLENIIASPCSLTSTEALEVYFMAFPERREALHVLVQATADEEVTRKVVRLSAQELPYSSFLNQALIPNECAVVSGLVSEWPIFEEWVTEDGGLNVKQMQSWGDSSVDVVCPAKGKREQMRLSEYLESWGNDGCGYLKDWHYRLDGAERLAPTPIWFRDDWLGQYLEHKRHTNDTSTDYNFVCMLSFKVQASATLRNSPPLTIRTSHRLLMDRLGSKVIANSVACRRAKYLLVSCSLSCERKT